MHNYNDELAYRHNLRRLEAYRQQAELQRTLRSANISTETYRSRLARSLQHLANWLEPDTKKGVDHALR